jgi:hypothetical protein
LTNLRQLLAGVRTVENHPELDERDALRTTAVVVLEERARLAGGHVEERTRPELPPRIEELPMKIKMVPLDGNDVSRAVGSVVIGTLIEALAALTCTVRIRAVGCPPMRRLSASMIFVSVPMVPEIWSSLVSRLTCVPDPKQLMNAANDRD